MVKLQVTFGLMMFVLYSVSGFANNIKSIVANNGNILMENIPKIPQTIADDLTRYQNIRSASFRGWSKDNKSIYITTRFSNVSQIHRVDQAAGTRHQLTFYDEPLGSVVRQTNGDLLAFSMDTGGSEYVQLFIFDPSTGARRIITDGKSRNGSLLWSPDGNKVAYYSTRRNGRSFDIWVTEIDNPQKSRMVFASNDGSAWSPADWTEDGKRLLIQQYVSINDSRIHLLDLASGEIKQLLGQAENPRRYNVVGFDMDDSGLFYVSDESSEYSQLKYQKLDGSVKNLISKGINWDVRGSTISEDGSRGAFVINQGGRYQLYLFNPLNFKYKAVSGLPTGLVYSLAFSSDNKYLAMNLNTAQTPSDVFVLKLKSSPLKYGQLKRWTYSEVGGLDTTAFIEPKLIHYPTFDQVGGQPRKIPAFVYKPKSKHPHPVVIYIHGGPEGQYRPSFNSRFQLWLKKLGVAVIAPNVRGSSGYGRDYVNLDNGFKREDSVKDIGALLDWIKLQPDLDENRVVVLGGSYGGYMVLASAAHYSNRLKAAVDIVGISNFVTFLKNTKSYRRDLRRVEYGDERDPEMFAHLQKISPNNNVNKISIPILIVQGENDPRVPVTESEQMVKAMRKEGLDVWYMNALNEGHGFRKKENRDLYEQVTVMFFKKHLGIN